MRVSPWLRVALGLVVLILLGVWGLWLINIPTGVAVAAGLLAGLAAVLLGRRVRRGSPDRQDTEA